MLVSSCASKKELQDCRDLNQKLLENGKEMVVNYQQA